MEVEFLTIKIIPETSFGDSTDKWVKLMIEVRTWPGPETHHLERIFKRDDFVPMFDYIFDTAKSTIKHTITAKRELQEKQD